MDNEEFQIEGLDDDTDVSGSNDEIDNPFNPKDIKINVEAKSLDLLITRMKHNAIDLNTEFQRKGNLWNQVTQSRLIESLLLKFPLPVFYFDASDEDNWLVVDGLQRLWSIKNFVIDKKLTLQGLEILKNYNGQGYETLSLAMQRRINETQITTYLVQPGSPQKVKYYVFRRINTGGLTLNSQEIRHALNQDQAAKFLRDVAENNTFRQALKIPDKRMQDRELILRSLTFAINDYSKYEKPLAEFLDRGMEQIDKLKSNQLETLNESFFSGLRRSILLFGRHAFSRSLLKGVKYRLNAALFEVWVSQLSILNSKQFEKLIAKREILIEDYKTLLANEDFKTSVVSSTSSKQSVTRRFMEIISLIEKHSK